MRASRSRQSLKRRTPTKEQNKSVLIVCEGKKTEPYYLNDLVRDLGIHAIVQITGECGSDPLSVTNMAINSFEKQKNYDHVYCVFDKDSHSNYAQALDKIKTHPLQIKARGKIVHTAKFKAIPSVPCFEYWILIHFTSTDAPFVDFAALRPQLLAIPQLSNYEKGSHGIYAALKENLHTARQNAARLRASVQKAATDNPSTMMDVLIDELEEMKTQAPAALKS